MEKEFVTYPSALRMKALGYNEPCLAYFLNSILQYTAWEKDYSYFNEMSDINPSLKKHEHVLAPTWQSAFAWFREKGEDCIILPTSNLYTPVVYNEKTSGKKKELYDTYEEAELACLEKLIEICSSK